jgi:maleate isomerase
VTEPVRVGLLVPSSNTVMETDFHRRLPSDRFTVHTGRMFLEETTPEAESEMLDHHVMPAARDVATARPDVLVFGCTSAGALRGNDADRELCDRMAAQTGTEVISTILSVRGALAGRGARRIGVITPYVDALNEKIRESIEADGIEVAAIEGLGITENFAIAEVEPEEIVAFARRTFEGLSIDLVFASCTNFRAVEALSGLEDAVGVPAISSNQAVLEAVLGRFGMSWPADAAWEDPVRMGAGGAGA